MLTFRLTLIVALLGIFIPAAADEAALQAVLERLGISLPSEVLSVRPIAQRLHQLRREPCDQTAIFQLQKALSDVGYRREAANALISFSGHCDDNAAALRAAANILLKLTDYRAVRS